MYYKFLIAVVVIVLFSVALLNLYIAYDSTLLKPACIDDDYRVFYAEVIFGNNGNPLHYHDDKGNLHYNFGADVILVDRPYNDEECQMLFAR